MKKLLVIPIMFLYMLAVSGLMVHAHYCGGNLESWNVYQKSDGCADEFCDDENEEESDGCCKDKLVVSKALHDQNFSDAIKIKISNFGLEGVMPENFISSTAAPQISILYSIFFQPNAPPGLWENIPLFKLHSGFIYYG